MGWKLFSIKYQRLILSGLGLDYVIKNIVYRYILKIFKAYFIFSEKYLVEMMTKKIMKKLYILIYKYIFFTQQSKLFTYQALVLCVLMGLFLIALFY